VNTVDVVYNQFPSLNWNASTQVAAIGPKTADALKTHGITPDFVPAEYVAEAILPGLGDLRGKWVLMPRAEIARKELPEAICNAGGVPHEITVYKTLPAQVNEDGLEALRAGVDMLTFTSVSTVENFVAITQKNKLDPFNLPKKPQVACIGPITAQAARQAGFENIIVAKEYTTDGLMEIVKNIEVA
jgi:uroporphyrinogen-III synthase